MLRKRGSKNNVLRLIYMEEAYRSWQYLNSNLYPSDPKSFSTSWGVGSLINDPQERTPTARMVKIIPVPTNRNRSLNSLNTSIHCILSSGFTNFLRPVRQNTFICNVI
jgi:hypothetical protein